MGKRTALYATHVALGGKIVEFGGFELPIQYKNGIIFEHNAVRNGVGLFDVSHMGEFLLHGGNAERALRQLVTNNVSTMTDGQCRYTLMCYPDGGIVDDLLIYKKGTDDYLLVVNAANIEKDFAWMQANLLQGAVLENSSDKISQIALQGPLAKPLLAKLCDMEKVPVKNYRFAENVQVAGINCLVSTTGYTAEAGYELYTANGNAAALYDALLKAGEEFNVQPAGLGARDTLRFEGSMPLYGHELTKDYLASEVGLDAFIKANEDFIGRDSIIATPPCYKRVGLKLIDKGIAREECDVYGENGEKIGVVTSGNPCPTLGGAYAMARVPVDYNGQYFIDVRGRRLRAEVTPMPFYKRAKG